MHNNKQSNEYLNCTSPTTKTNRNTAKQQEVSNIGNTSGATSRSCTSSTDSGVNISDNEEIPSSLSPKNSQSFSSSTFSNETNTAVNSCHKIFHKNNKNKNQDNNVNNIQGKKCNNTNFNHTNFIFKSDNEVEYDDENDDNNSENFDNKFQVINSSNEYNTTRYQSSQNIIESKTVKDISQRRSFKTLRSTETPKTTAKSSDNPLVQHNEFPLLQQRPVSTSSSLSTSSITKGSDNNPPSKMLQFSGSPVVSIRSINSSIIISDSDSNLNSDTEGTHENYVITKLGTQVTYLPEDPDIPNINSGHTVLNQKVILDGSQVPPSPLATLAAIGDSIGAAQALGPVTSIPAIAQRPQIGSIALSNSSDVTFGDKHFYEGPVTIQQFLIDGRDKWKDKIGSNNRTFVNENVETSANNAKDINSSTEKSSKLFNYILKRKKVLIPSTLALMAMLIVATIFGSKTLNDSKSKLLFENSEELRNLIPINSTIDTNNNHTEDNYECEGNGTLCLIERDVWRAHPQKNDLDKQVLPLHRVIISHTASEPCVTIKICAEHVRVIQEFHMNSLGWDDIAYNFLISSDGRVYVGRGWDFVGAHTKGYNYDSVGITFIGTYISTPPSEVQLEACLSLLYEGVRLMKLTPNYRLYGARQLGATESPAQDNIGGGYVLRIVPRVGWLAQPPVNSLVQLNHPIDRVIVIPTRTSECETQAACTYTVRITQTYNIESQQQDDIIYNFLIGGDGNVYEGRGWANKGSVIKGFNDDSISFAYIGSFKRQPPSYKQLNVTKLLLQEGVRLKMLSTNYKIVGANALDSISVATIADALYKSFENWPHWSDK